MRRLLRDYTRPHLWRLLLAMLTMGVASAMTAAQAKLLEPIINDIFVSREADRLWPIAMMVVAVFLARGVATYIHTVQTNFVGQRVVATIQHQLFRHLLRADLAFFHSRGSGQLISSLVNDVNVMRYAVVESLTTSVKSTLTLVFLVALMFATDWVLATATFIVFPAGGLFVASRGKRQRRYSNQSQEELGVFSSLLGQVFQGARHVKAYGAEAFEERRVGDVIERMFRIAHKSVRLTAASSPVMETLSGLAIVVLILY
ncbi:MAG TPA: ABC transporter transmembrane domain-containing protein, partial [Alphaproteobacteria bacterium]|nr:ABC transporter transmembrane domain-containing protein [Alphaproteobacteria bacterium]